MSVRCCEADGSKRTRDWRTSRHVLFFFTSAISHQLAIKTLHGPFMVSDKTNNTDSPWRSDCYPPWTPSGPLMTSCVVTPAPSCSCHTGQAPQRGYVHSRHHASRESPRCVSESCVPDGVTQGRKKKRHNISNHLDGTHSFRCRIPRHVKLIIVDVFYVWF